MAVGYNPKIITDGLVLALDAGNTKSYDTIITYVGGTSDSDNSTSFTLSGLQAGDFVLYFGAEDAANVNTPTGESWTAIPGLGTQPDNNTPNPKSAAFYVFASGTSVTASGLATGNHHVRVMIAFRNVNSTNPFDVNATQNSASGGLPNPPSITPVTDNSMIVAVGFLDDDSVGSVINPPTGYTTALNMDDQGGVNDPGVGGATIMTAYKLLTTAAAEDPGAFTGGGGDPQKGISIALRQETNLTWTDLMGNNNGTLTNGPTYSSANGGSIVFDGTNDVVTIGSMSTFAPTAVTFETWFKHTYSSGYKGLIDKGRDSYGGYSLNIDETFKKTRFKVRVGSNSKNVLSSTEYVNDVWNHVVGTYDGTDLKIYLNGSLDGTTNAPGTMGTNTIDVRIGSTNDGLVYDGNIAISRIYNKALTAAEVEQNYNALKGRYV